MDTKGRLTGSWDTVAVVGSWGSVWGTWLGSWWAVFGVLVFGRLVTDEVNFRLGWLGWSWSAELDGWSGVGLLEQDVNEGLLFWCWGQVFDFGLFIRWWSWGADEQNLVVLLWDQWSLGGLWCLGFLGLFGGDMDVDVLVDLLFLGWVASAVVSAASTSAAVSSAVGSAVLGLGLLLLGWGTVVGRWGYWSWGSDGTVLLGWSSWLGVSLGWSAIVLGWGSGLRVSLSWSPRWRAVVLDWSSRLGVSLGWGLGWGSVVLSWGAVQWSGSLGGSWSAVAGLLRNVSSAGSSVVLSGSVVSGPWNLSH